MSPARALRGAAEGAPLWIAAPFALACLAYVGLHAGQVIAYWLPSGQFKIVHLGGGLVILLLALAGRAARPADRALNLGLAILAAAATLYVWVEHEALTTMRSFLPSPTDFWVALALLALALWTSGREWGWTVTAIAAAGLAYGWFGPLFPEGLLYHGGLAFDRLIGRTSIPYFSGLLGNLTELSAGTIFPFMLLAAAMTATGCVDFIMRTAFRIGGRSRAGPAQIAVIASGFMGMVSGSSVANVASTGALTIPLMKRVGFSGPFAGAVEAVASTGGQITPPVMGLAAFLIVGLTGAPYVEVIAAAAFPAAIYYAYLMVAVHLRAVALGLDASSDTGVAAELGAAEPFGRDAARHLHFFVAIGYLVVVLIRTNLPGRTAVEATALLLALFALRELALNWRSARDVVAGLSRLALEVATRGARVGASVGVVVAVIGVLVDVLTTTGFAQKLSFWMLELAGGELGLLLVVAAFACLAFGLGLPTSAAYILVALLGAPALVELGVPLLAAHMFVFFFANVSAITPPVAVSCLVASKIAEAGFFRTSFLALRLGLPGFILPFLFALHPEILGLDATLAEAALVSAMALAGVIALNVMIEGRLSAPLGWVERALLAPAAAGLLHPSLWASAAGVTLFAAVAALSLRRSVAEA
jgi:TRAP transporter 4TM/12TM fusion protein